MKVPIYWLKQYIKTSLKTDEIAHILTSIGHMKDSPIIKIDGEEIIDLEIRQNRPDCLSIVGIARELSASTNSKFNFPILDKKATFADIGNWKVVIDDKNLCYRFNTIKIKNVKITKSPDWLIKALKTYGMESINNIVDITNYVMIELGQPMHAFDENEIKGNILIRKAKTNEKFVSLGDRKFNLTTDDLVISDSEKILGLAGVIGSSTSGVSSNTASIILEAATYNQASIRRTSLRHQIRTEASTRLEKFLHPQLTSVALCRSAYLIAQVCGGKVTASVDAYPQIKSLPQLALSVNRIKLLGGIKIDKSKIISILKSLEFEVKSGKKDIINVEVPYFRTDITQEEDLIEEVLRMVGYDKIPTILPDTSTPVDIESKYYQLEEKIRDVMSQLGFDEHITEPLTNETYSKKTPVKLQNSLSSDKSMLRTTLQNNLYNVYKNYLKHRRETVKVYEVGKIYYIDKSYEEQRTVGVLVSSPEFKYIDMKGVIETLVAQIGKSINDKVYEIVAIDNNLWYAEINTDQLIKLKDAKPSVVLTSPLKLVFQDLSLIGPAEIKVGDVIKSILSIDHRVYRVDVGEEPKKINSKSKSIFLKLAFSDKNNLDLTPTSVEQLRSKILNLLTKHYDLILAQNTPQL